MAKIRGTGVIASGIEIPDGNPDDYPLENVQAMIKFEQDLISAVHKNIGKLEAMKKLFPKSPQFVSAINATIAKEEKKLPESEKLIAYLERELAEEKVRRAKRNKPS